jgi:hypothetical protein
LPIHEIASIAFKAAAADDDRCDKGARLRPFVAGQTPEAVASLVEADELELSARTIPVATLLHLTVVDEPARRLLGFL